MGSGSRHRTIPTSLTPEQAARWTSSRAVTRGCYAAGIRSAMENGPMHSLVRIAVDALSKEWCEPRPVADKRGRPSVGEWVPADAIMELQRLRRLQDLGRRS